MLEKKYKIDLSSNDYVMRDHTVQGVTVIPGLAMIDIIVRAFGNIGIRMEEIVINKLLFYMPVWATPEFDRRLFLNIKQVGENDFVVEINSCPLVKGVPIEKYDTNATLKVNRVKNRLQNQEKIDINKLENSSLIDKCDMDKAYEIVRNMRIIHGPFLQAIGNVFAYDDKIIVEMELSDFAKANHPESFSFHPSLLDCSALPFSYLFNDKNNKDYKENTFIPIYIEKFYCTGNPGNKIYMETPVNSVNKNQDLVYKSCKIYDKYGSYIGEFKNLGAKKIRDFNYLNKQVANTTGISASLNLTEEKKEQTITETIESTDYIEMLKSVILDTFPNISVENVEIGFYDLGLDSSGLLKIVKKLENKLNVELYPTLLFEYKNIKELAQYLEQEYPSIQKEQENVSSSYQDSYIIDNKNQDYVEKTEQPLHKNITEHLIKILQSINQELGEDIDINVGFYDLGLDSSNLLKMVKEIEILLKIELYPTLLFEYKNIKELGEYLYENYLNEIQSITPKKDKSDLEKIEKIDQIKENDLNFYKPCWQELLSNQKSTDFLEKVNLRESKDKYVVIIDSKSNSNDVIQIFKAVEEKRQTKKLFVYIDYIPEQQQAENSIFLVTHLLKEIYKLNIDNFVLVINNYDTSNIFIRSLTGYFKTASIEFPKARFVLIENYTQPGIDHFENLNTHYSIIENTNKGFTHYKTNSDKIYTSLYTKTSLKIPEREKKFKKGGKYLITGGSGGIARLIAKYLLKEYQAELCMTSRSEKTPEIQELINLTKETGGKLIYTKADLSDKKQVFDTIRKMRSVYKEIDGIFHCAGLLKDSRIIDKNVEQISLILSPKIIATNNLDEATRNEKLDFFMVMSSLSSVVGNAGQADYAYANSYLNEFVVERNKQVHQQQRSGKSISITWPFWKDGGMKIEEDLIKQMKAFFGLRPISNSEGLSIIELSLQDETGEILIPVSGIPKRINYLSDKEYIKNNIINEQVKEKNIVKDRNNTPSDVSSDNNDIAIVGISGKFPKSENLEEFWRNISQGKFCVEEIPENRWNKERFYTQDRTEEGKYYCKYGGFINGYDEFDPLFFNISPEEAERMDPNERLFLLETWRAFEDAGYSQKRISEVFQNEVGVFTGVMWGDYEAIGLEKTIQGDTKIVISNLSTIANRVSFFFNLKGPSMPVDTMCSSSTMALHLACQAILNGECKAAVAGAVNLSIHPWKYIKLSQMQMLSPQGACKAFGEGADGYVPGEGVVSLILKPYSQAIKDHDSIYAVIKGTGVKHSGYTSGLTVPSPVSQAETMKQAIKNSNVPEDCISYIEAHGTGTSLGDPIEISGLRLAFKNSILKKRYIGSVKSNIGHLEAAAGLTSIAKVCLQFKHKKIAPSLYTEKLNPKLELNNTNFTIVNNLINWNEDENNTPLTATVSSFGAGGTNVCVVLQKNYFKHKYLQPTDQYFVITLSAKNEKTLKNYIDTLHSFFNDKQETTYNLQAIENTFKHGRTSFKERRVIVYTSINDLVGQLNYSKNIKAEDIRLKIENIEIKEKDKIINWLEGKEVIWDNNLLEKYGMASLPFYPFDLKKYWIDLKDSIFFSKNTTILTSEKRTNSTPQIEEENNLEEQNKKSFIENILFKVLYKILKIDKSDISLEEPIFNIGIDSVIAMKIVSELEQENIKVSLAFLAENPTLKELISNLVYTKNKEIKVE